MIALSLITFHLLSNPHVLEKLRKELETAFPDPEVLPPCSEFMLLPMPEPRIALAEVITSTLIFFIAGFAA